MADYKKSNAQGAVYALVGMAIFATHDVVVKYLGTHGFSAMQIMFFAALLSFPIVTILLMGSRERETLIPRHPYWMALRTVCTVLTGLSAFYGFTVLPLAQTYAILFATPLLITILAIPILGEKVGPRRWAAVLVGLLGVLVVLQPGSSPMSFGHFAVGVAVICGGTASVISRKIGQEERSVVMLLYPMIGNFVAMALVLPFVYVPMEIEHLGLLSVIAGFGLIASFLVLQAYRRGEAAIVAPMQYSQIIWATIFGYLLFDETISLSTFIGTAIIIGSGVYIVVREGRGGASANQPVSRTRLRNETVTTPRISILNRILSGKRLTNN